jgi:hypothetical protein
VEEEDGREETSGEVENEEIEDFHEVGKIRRGRGSRVRTRTRSGAGRG